MKLSIPECWQSELEEVIHSSDFQNLSRFLESERERGARIFPEPPSILQALEDVSPDAARVVILGQDPYHGEGQAIGRSFAVPNRLKPKPPSLKNILKELEQDLGVTLDPIESDLSGWARQGIMMLNTVLTVEAHMPLSHQGKGWEAFTDSILMALNRQNSSLVFVLWGAHAQKKKPLIENKKHRIFESAHPSPLSARRGFFGSRVFSRINEHFIHLGEPPINWTQVTTQITSEIAEKIAEKIEEKITVP
jgi:uracil-DNA glycosylase